MKLVLILSIFVAVCYTQTPTRPVIPETFQSQVDVVFYEHETYYGQGKIARDQMKNEGVEDLVSRENSRDESRIRLERYDMSEEFFVRGSGDQMHCEVRKVNSTTLPPYWEWVQRAHYMGKKELKNITYDIWEGHGPGMFLELLVDDKEVNVPRFMNVSLGAGIREIYFIDFMATTPPESDFNIPQVCQQ